MNNKKYSAACERNQSPILQHLTNYFAAHRKVLEIGSGTGQHAVYFAEHLPHLLWQTSDRLENHESITAWIDGAALTNVLKPFELDVNQTWPDDQFDAAFTANTCHIMAWDEVRKMFLGLSTRLHAGGTIIIYGPFNYDGRYTSPSNETFDHSLRNQAPHMGIRDIEAILDLANEAGLFPLADHPMPANNRLLVFQKTTKPSPAPKSD